ncbi:MAG: efflux RND transporter permease subunit [Fimbriimonadaceae bacterium]
MNIGRLSVTRPVAVSMRIAALVLLGYICFLRLPIDLLPRVDIPTVAVTVSWPNTGPEEMESQICRPMEQAVASVRGLYMVSSTASQGNCFIRVQFDYGVNIDQAAIDVTQAVQRAKGRFPNDPNISEPQVFKFDPSNLPILVYGVSAKDPDLIKLRTRMINEISPIIESSGGVAQVQIAGGQDRAIMVDVDPAKLRAYGIGISTISRRLREENLSQPAGTAQEGQTQYAIRSVGYFKSIDDIRRVPIANVGGRLVSLGEVALVRDASRDVLSFTRMGGVPALNVSISKQSDANTVAATEGVFKAIKEIQARNPDLNFGLLYHQANFIESSIVDLKESAVIGGVLAILLITFFLRNLRSTFVVALSIPISIVSTFSLLYFCGFTLNTISLSGLALATGLIVDDAIVVLENIYRHIERDGKRSADAAVSGTQEILSAVFASTFTVMIVFLPLFMIKGQSGQTFTQFALVIVFSLAVSLLDAITVVPMLASRLIREKEVIEEAHPELRQGKASPLTRVFDRFGLALHGLDQGYRNGLVWTIKHRWLVVGGGFASCVLAFLLWPYVGKENLPQTDSGNLQVRVRLPIGTAVSVTDATMKKVEAVLSKDKEIQTYIVGAGTNVGLRGGGGGGGGGGSTNEGGATIKLYDNRKTSTADMVKRLQGQLSSIPGARVQVSPVDIVANILGGANFGFGIDIYGQDLAQLTEIARNAQAALSEIPGLQNVDLNVQDTNPEIQWSIDRQKAQSMGISFSDVAATLNAATNGQLSSYYQEKGFQYPILVQIPLSLRSTVDELKNLPIDGSPVLLGQVATASYGVGPNQISRQNRQRIISVNGRIQDRPESEVQADVQKAMKKVTFPSGTYWNLGVQQLRRDQEYGGMQMAIFLAIALIYMLLATQFESFVYPLVVLVSVPMSAVGLVLALFLTDRAFGLTAMIGLLMLMGIAVKNGILLVDYTNQLRARGMPRDEALLTAGPTRLRPILMTSTAAVLGMLPLALGIGSGSELYVPLATAVIGGLITSTVLTLFIVPAVYTFFDDLTRKSGKFDRDLAPSHIVEPSEAAIESAPSVK